MGGAAVERGEVLFLGEPRHLAGVILAPGGRARKREEPVYQAGLVGLPALVTPADALACARAQFAEFRRSQCRELVLRTGVKQQAVFAMIDVFVHGRCIGRNRADAHCHRLEEGKADPLEIPWRDIEVGAALGIAQVVLVWVPVRQFEIVAPHFIGGWKDDIMLVVVIVDGHMKLG